MLPIWKAAGKTSVVTRINMAIYFFNLPELWQEQVIVSLFALEHNNKLASVRKSSTHALECRPVSNKYQ